MIRGLAAAWVLLLGLSVPAAHAEPGCVAPALEPAAVRDQLRHWSGLTPFAQWRLLDVRLPACAEGEQLQVQLTVAPPERWSRLKLPYRLRLDVQLDPQGAPAAAAPGAWRTLPAALKRLVERFESDEDVARFVSRHQVVQAVVQAGTCSGEAACPLQILLQTDPGPDQPAERGAGLTYREAAPGGVVAYQLPRMDAWPARRELLRFVEVLSQRYPDCRPVWLEARTGRSAGDDPGAAAWSVSAQLSGRGCPEEFLAQLTPDGAVAQVPAAGEPLGSKGE